MNDQEKLEMASDALQFIEFWMRKNRKTEEKDAAEIVAYEALISLGLSPIEMV